MGKEKRIRKQTVEKEPIPQDGGYGWVILGGCFIISFIVDGIMYSFGIILPYIGKHYQVNESQTNLLTSLYTGFLFCSGPIVAGLSNAFGVRPVVIAGSAITALSFVATAFSPTIIGCYIFYGVIGGIATGCCYIGSLLIVCQYFDRLKGLATGIVMSGSGFGSFALAPFGAWLVGKYDWIFSLIVFGAMILQCCITGALMKPCPVRLVAKDPNAPEEVEPEKRKPSIDTTENKSVKQFQSTASISMFQSKNSLTNNQPVYISNTASNKKLNIQTFAGSMVSIGNFNQTLNMKSLEDEFLDQPWYQRFYEITLQILKDIVNVKLLVQNFEFFCLAMCNFFCFLGLFIPYIYIPVHAEKTGLSGSQASFILSIIGIVNIPMRLAFGFIADKKIIPTTDLNTIAISIVFASVWCISLFNTYGLQIAFGVAFAVGTAGMNILPNKYLDEAVGSLRFNNALGIVNLLRGIACFLGPYIGGLIATQYQNYLYAFYFSALSFTLGAVSSLICGLYNKFKKCFGKKDKPSDVEMSSLKENKV